MSDPRLVIERLVGAQNAHDIDAFVACFAQDYRSEQPNHPELAFVGEAQVRKNWTTIFTSVPDFSAELLDCAVAGPSVWAEVEWKGTKEDGSRLHSRGVIIATTDQDRINAARLYVSNVVATDSGIDEAVRGMAGRR
jgi:hypothetical protein